MKLADLADPLQTPYGDYSLVIDEVPRIRPYLRNRRLPFTVTNVQYSELSQELLPDRSYRRGDAVSEIPKDWDGISFSSSFGLGGSDMPTMRDMITVLRHSPVVTSPNEHNNGTMEQSTRLVSDLNTKDRTRRLADGEKKDSDYDPILITSLDVPNDRSRITVHADFYDGGVISRTPLVPSISSDFTVRESTPIERVSRFSTSPDGKTKWEYQVHVNAGRDKQKSKFVRLPINNIVRVVYQQYKECYETMIDYVDAITHTNVA